MIDEPHADWLRTFPIGLGCGVAFVPAWHEFRVEAPANDEWAEGPEAA